MGHYSFPALRSWRYAYRLLQWLKSRVFGSVRFSLLFKYMNILQARARMWTLSVCWISYPCPSHSVESVPDLITSAKLCKGGFCWLTESGRLQNASLRRPPTRTEGHIHLQLPLHTCNGKVHFTLVKDVGLKSTRIRRLVPMDRCVVLCLSIDAVKWDELGVSLGSNPGQVGGLVVLVWPCESGLEKEYRSAICASKGFSISAVREPPLSPARPVNDDCEWGKEASTLLGLLYEVRSKSWDDQATAAIPDWLLLLVLVGASSGSYSQCCFWPNVRPCGLPCSSDRGTNVSTSTWIAQGYTHTHTH